MNVLYTLKKAWYFLVNRPIYISEPGLNRMLPSIPGWLDKGHIYCFDYAIKNLPDNNPIVEIGTFAGLSTNVILYFLHKHGKPNKLISTDWFLQDIDAGETIAMLKNPKDLSRYIKELFVKNVRFFSPEANIAAFDMASDDFFKAWAEQRETKDLFGNSQRIGGSISFAYIDGNHVYEYARRDFENVDKYLVTGGFILFDDSAGYTCWGSKKVAQEALKSGKYRLVKKNPHYFIQKK